VSGGQGSEQLSHEILDLPIHYANGRTLTFPSMLVIVCFSLLLCLPSCRGKVFRRRGRIWRGGFSGCEPFWEEPFLDEEPFLEGEPLLEESFRVIIRGAHA
jgi:hypothetical protein